MKFILINYLLFIIGNTLFSQIVPHIHYTTDNGLCYNSVRCITKDYDNNYWIGTDNGISKFDGNTFKNFFIQEGLPSIRIWAITVDDDNSVWAGAYDYGIFKIKNDSVVEKHKISEKIKPYNTVRELFYSKTYNSLFVGTDYGLKVFKDSVFKEIIYHTNWDSTKMTTVLKIKEYKNKIYFSVVNSYRGLYSLEIKDGEFIIDTILKNKHTYGFKILNDTIYANIDKVPVKISLNDRIIKKIPNNNVERLVWDVEKYNNQFFLACWGGSEHTGGGLANINLANIKNTKYNIKSSSIWQFYKDTTTNTLWLSSGDNGIYVLFDNPFNYFSDIDEQIIDIEKYENNSALILTNSDIYLFKNKTITKYLSVKEISLIIKKKTKKKVEKLKFMKFERIDSKLILSTNKGKISLPNYSEYYPFRNGSIIFDNNNGMYYIPDYSHLRYYSNKNNIKEFKNIPRPAPLDVIEMLKQGSNKYMCSWWNGIYLFKNDTTFYYLDNHNSNLDSYLSDIDTTQTGNLWASSLYGNLFKIKFNEDSLIIDKTINEKSGLLGRTINWIKFHNNYLFVSTNLGLNIIPTEELKKEKIQKIYFFNENNGFTDTKTQKAIPLNNNTLLICSNENIITVNTNKLDNKTNNGFNINNIYADNIKYNLLNNIELPYNVSSIVISYNMIGIPNSKNIKYRYKINEANWSKWIDKNNISFNSLKSGNYVVDIQAKDLAQNIILSKQITFKIAFPYWETLWFKILMIIILVIIMLIIAQIRLNKIKKKKKELENIVLERTNELLEANEELNQQAEELKLLNENLNQQNEEITAQRDEIDGQKNILLTQKNEIETIHNSIAQSIDYATRLQGAILPEEKLLKKHLSEHFVLFKPKDKVSGDFYWWANVNNKTVITAADSTGHGVPGAFMSMLGGSFLREIVQKEEVTNTGKVLGKLRKEIIKALKQTGEEKEQKDGMDMAIISIDHETNMVQYSGANNPLYIVSQSIKGFKPLMDYGVLGLYEVKPNKMPISIYEKMDVFTTHEIQLQKGDQLYMFSDGYADQFGGPKGKKFKYKPFKKLLLENADKPMSEQKEILNQAFENWKGNEEQIDDVVIVGVKI